GDSVPLTLTLPELKYHIGSEPKEKKLKVTCILPPIPHDPEDDVSMEDEHSDELESVKDISKKGYKFKADDWKNRLAKLLLRLRRTQKIPN
ncbi:unnamed protein product, partial [Brassica oleracea]